MNISLPNAEIRPAVDESPPVIGPNLAENQELAAAVTKHIIQDFWWGYEQQQMLFWPAWRRVDEAWRARVANYRQNPSVVSQKAQKSVEPAPEDGVSAKAQSVMPFKQMHAIADIGEQLSFEDGIPCRAVMPEDADEGDFYRPTEQSTKAVNSLLRQNADDIDFRTAYRKSFGGNFAKYGIAWVSCPFEMKVQDVICSYPLSAVPEEAAMQLQMLAMQHPGAQPQILPNAQGGQTVIYQEKQIERFITHFHHCSVSDVFIDPLLPCDPMDAQPCPFVREHVNDAALEQNAYDPVNNPFGYVNVEKAIKDTNGHYVLAQEDEGILFNKLKYRYNLSDQMTPRVAERIKQRWTAYPLLRLSEETGELDTGDGVTCPACAGAGKMISDMGEQPCQTCAGSGKAHPPLRRYVWVGYGGMRSGVTCIRLQAMPVTQKGEQMEVPILYAADLVEDDSCSYPMGKGEIAMIAVDQLTLAESQFQDAKEQVINRGYKVKMDSPAYTVPNLNKPKDGKIPFDYDPDEVQRLEQSTYDETETLLPYMERKDAQIQAIWGATDTLLGIISQGRRSALEIGEATNAAKNPLVLMVDRYNAKIPGGWARKALKNIEMFGDRDYIRRKTGREFFGRVRIFTAVGQEFVKKLAAEQNLRWLLQASPTIPSMQPVVPQVLNKLLPMMGIFDIRVPDMGLAEGVQRAMRIVSDMLGTGIPTVPEPDDPHEIYLQVFNGAMKDPYWQENAPQNLPLLAQRIAQQQQLYIQQQMAMMQAQMAMNGPQEEGGGRTGNQPSAPQRTPKDSGQQQQQIQG